MKKLIFVFFLLLSLQALALTNLRSPVTDIYPTDRDFVYEVRSPRFEKVILDCASFIAGISFYQSNQVSFYFYLEGENCQRMYDVIIDSFLQKQQLCFDINVEENALNVAIDEVCQ